MGYTNYLRFEPAVPPIANIVAGYAAALPHLRDIHDRFRGILAGPEGDRDTVPLCDASGISLNGVEADAYETFYFYPEAPEPFSFCKTAGNDYDAPVCEMMLVLGAHVPNLVVTSDGFNGNIGDLVKFGLPEALDGKWGRAFSEVGRYGVRAEFRYGYHGAVKKGGCRECEEMTPWDGTPKSYYAGDREMYRYFNVAVSLSRA